MECDASTNSMHNICNVKVKRANKYSKPGTHNTNRISTMRQARDK